MRVAIVGCGLIGQKRAASLPTSTEIVGCFDSNFVKAIQFSDTFKTNYFNSISDLFEQAKPSLTFVATDHRSLSQITEEALESGSNVLVEKPGAISAKKLKKVYKKSLASNLKIHVGYNHQFHPSLLKAQELIKNNSIGEIMFIRGRYGHGGRIGYEKEWRANKDISGGGELIDQGSHLIDISLSILGNLELDYAATPNYFWKMDVEDNAFISLKSENQNIAFLQASWTEWKNIFSLEIYGHHGKIDIQGLGGSYGTEKLTFHKMLPEMGPPLTESWIFDQNDESWAIETAAFIDEILNKSKDSENIKRAIRALELIEEIYDRTGR